MYLHISIRIFCTLFICFVLDGLFAIDLFPNVLFQTFDYFWKPVYIKFRFCESFTVINSVPRIVIIETLYKFRTIKYWLTLYFHMYVFGLVVINSNILCIPPSFITLHIPVIFILQQLKISEKCTLFHAIKL